jgi:signal transduction histidine kinase
MSWLNLSRANTATEPKALAHRYRRRILPRFLLLAFVLCLVLGVAMSVRQLRALADDQAVQARILAARVGDSISQLTTQMEALQTAIAASKTSNEIEAQLRRGFATLPLISKIGVIDLDNRSETFLDIGGVKRSLLTRMSSSTAPSVGLNVLRARAKEETNTRFSFRADRNYSRWLEGELNGSNLSETVIDYGAQNGTTVYLIDDDRRFVAHPNPLRVLRAERSERFSSAIDRVLGGNTRNTLLVTDEKGALWLTSTMGVKNTPWQIVVERPAIQSVTSLLDLFWLVIAALALAVLLSYFVAAQLAELLSEPVLRLNRFASALRSGELASFDAEKAETEFADLANTLSEMSLTIQENYRLLDRRVADKTDELAKANEALEVANRHKSDFLAHMSHELRTPLNAVIGFSEMLKAQYFGPLNAKQAEYVNDINASGQHLLSLINDILDLAKVEAGRMELSTAETPVGALVDACVSLVSERCVRKSQRLSCSVTPESLSWLLDERKAKQCLLNLITNAHKFTDEGGEIDVTVHAANDVLIMSVSDTGIGIPSDSLPRLFDEFYQVEDHSVEAKQREGTGLGLALTKRLVELHGGTLQVTSKPRKGSTFTLQFPKGTS